jgi:integrase
MARPKQDGLKEVTKVRSDGSTLKYFYDRQTKTFLGNDREQALARQIVLCPSSVPTDTSCAEGSFGWLIDQYRKDPKFTSKAPKTRKGYDFWLRELKTLYGDLPVRSIKAKTIRAIRNNLLATPAKANQILALFSILLGFAHRDLEIIESNPATRPGRLPPAKRDQVWSDEDIETFLDAAPANIRLAMGLLFHTAQRVSDMLDLDLSKLSESGGRLYLQLRQQKTQKWVRVPVHRRLEALLRERLNNPPPIGRDRPRGEALIQMVRATSQVAVAKDYGVTPTAVRKWLSADLVSAAAPKDAKEVTYLVYSPEGHKWNISNFSADWDAVVRRVEFRTAKRLFAKGYSKAEVRAELDNRHRQRRDLRRTAIVRMAEAGATTPQIAAVSGHSIDTCQKILDVYLPRRSEVALGAITAWENFVVIEGSAHQNVPNRAAIS